MIEIVFTESAAGSLKVAQHYGEGEYKEWCAWGIISGDETPTEEELEKIQKEYEAQARADWEAAVPLGGNGGDVFSLGITWSMGDISEGDTSAKRMEVLSALYKFYPEKDLMITDIDQQSDKIIIQMKSTSSSCKCPKCNRIT